ncbi:conserved exported protein of unknown function [Pseudodesulfovibrio profundus]|uniref:PDZ domain-containing protein n=1 Tax=Pseudodesulfovibrio profundus TaxID=57320 RepID=A0A2C8F9A8_9BACT|nr:ChaN family lipoprotein [Pseudodesulfovibrio profundus]SOB59009.1 conserved exported protein of unknown function [Pseudodesulfovibrio profundus]
MNWNKRVLSRKKTAICLLLCLTFALGACMKRVEHPPLDVTFVPSSGDFISPEGERLSLDAVLDMAKGKDYILLGEGHKNICDHSIQQQIVSRLSQSDTPPAVGLEMVAVDKQPVLDDFAAGMIEVADLEEELEWSERWGYPYSLFEGLFEIVREHSLPISGLNAPRSVTKKITENGLESLTDEERALLPAEIVPPAKEQKAFLDEVFAQHSTRDTDDPDQRERFFLVQSIWDSKMAEEAVALRKRYDWPVVIIAGSAHVENGWGIARRLKKFDPDAETLIVMPWRGGSFDKDSGDVFFYCPDKYRSKMGATLVATGQGGLLVEQVERGSRADEAGLRPGDVLLEAADIPLDYLFSLHMAGTKVYKADEDLVFVVRRGEAVFSVNVGKLGKKGKAESESVR